MLDDDGGLRAMLGSLNNRITSVAVSGLGTILHIPNAAESSSYLKFVEIEIASSLTD